MQLNAVLQDGLLTLSPAGRDDWFEVQCEPGNVWQLYEIPNHGGMPQWIKTFDSVKEAIEAGCNLT